MQTPSESVEPRKHLKIFMAAGEVSGDRHGASLASALLERQQDLTLFGAGGEQMARAGVDVRQQTACLGCVGLEERRRFRQRIRQARRELCALVDERKPDLAILIDGEGFICSLAAHLHARKIPFVYYFAPQVWLWGKWRTRKIARRARLILPAFPAETKLFEQHGGRVQWLGHPLTDIVAPEVEPARAFSELGLHDSRPTIGLMPGSRLQEVEGFTPTLLEAASRLRQHNPDLQFVLPLAAPHLLPIIENELRKAGLTQSVRIIDHNVYACLSRCSVVLLSSGTATLELALLGVPMVAFYRVGSLTYALGRMVVSARYIAMPNILLDAPVVPELIQNDFTADNLVVAALGLLENKERSDAMRTELKRVHTILGKPGVVSRAAGAVLRECAAQGEWVDRPAPAPSYA